MKARAKASRKMTAPNNRQVLAANRTWRKEPSTENMQQIEKALSTKIRNKTIKNPCNSRT